MIISNKNGNVQTTIDTKTGTRILEWPDDEWMNLVYPLSMDVKITQYCDLGNICVYCHEMSDLTGKHANLSKLLNVLHTCLPGTEIAIGGGNPMAHPDLEMFLRDLKNANLIANLTVNEMHLSKYSEQIVKFQKLNLIKGLGISYRGKKQIPIEVINSNTVLHIIAGIDELPVILKTPIRKILILGFKTFGKGKAEHIDQEKVKSYRLIKNLSRNFQFSFDNLAITQLKEFIPPYDDMYYNGGEGESTFYIDAVEETYSIASYSSWRQDLLNNVSEMFINVRKAAKEGNL